MPQAERPPVRIGVISAGQTGTVSDAARAAGLRVLLQDDPPRAGPAPDDDSGLLFFLLQMDAISRSLGDARPFAYAMIGNIWSVQTVYDAAARLLALQVDLLVWWSFTPDDVAAFGPLHQAIVGEGVAAVFPRTHAFGPGLFGVNGVVAEPPHLDLCPMPPGATPTPPEVVAWGSWEMMHRSWAGARVDGGPLPATLPTLSGHTLATWSVAAMLALLISADGRRPSLAELAAKLRTVCCPVRVRPEAMTPSLGFFEPRQLEAIAMLGGR